METLPKFAIKRYSTHVAMIVIFVHNYVLDKNLECTCEDDQQSCVVYMALPALILFALQLWTNKTFKILYRYTCNCKCKFFLVLTRHILKAACVGLLWILFLLIDGDWFVCCHNTYKEHPDLGCKEKLNITEKERVLIAKLKNKSMLIGLGILLVGFVVVTFVLSCGWKKCCKCCSSCEKKCSDCCEKNCSNYCGKKFSDCCGKIFSDCCETCARCCGTCASWCDGNHLYDQMILEEEGNVLRGMIRNTAKENLTEKMQEKLGTGRWRECFDVAKDLITKKTPPGKQIKTQVEIPLEDKHPETEKLMKDAGTSTTSGGSSSHQKSFTF